MKREKLIRLPVIYNAGGDLSKKWFIEFYVKNPRTGRLERQRKAKGINKFHSEVERINAAEEMKKYWTDKLLAGWSPFTDESVIYDDNLEYQTFIKNYRTTKSRNGTFRFYASKYINFIQNNVENSTIITYRSKLRLFDAWLESKVLNDIDVSGISQPTMEEFFYFIIETRKLSRVSVMHYRQLLIQVFNLVQKERKQFINPCFNLPETKRDNNSTPQPIQKVDILKFKDEISRKDPQLWMAICFEYYCFIRPGKELRLLKIGDIDFGRGTIRIVLSNAKTLERHVSVPGKFLNLLRDTYKLHTYPRKHYVFSHGGTPGPTCLGKNNLSMRFTRTRKKLKMPEMYKFYSWKHTGNIAADDAGIPLRQLQGQNGHASIQTTEVYLKNKRGMRSELIKNDFPDI